MKPTMRRILVIDDELHIRKSLRATLERLGHFVLEAADGVEGIHLYQTQPIDLVITDIMMPRKDGLEVIMELAFDFPDVKIIALSSDNTDAKYTLKAARDFGAICTFTKPFKLTNIQNVVQEILGTTAACSEFEETRPTNRNAPSPDTLTVVQQ